HSRIVLVEARLVLNPTARTEHYTLSLHDALPIWRWRRRRRPRRIGTRGGCWCRPADRRAAGRGRPPAAPRDRGPPSRRGREAVRSEEHTSELQSRENLVCRLLLEKKKHKQVPQLD